MDPIFVTSQSPVVARCIYIGIRLMAAWMPKVRSRVPIDYSAKDIQKEAVTVLQGRGYSLVSQKGKTRSFVHSPTAGKQWYCSEHRLDLRIDDQAPGYSRLAFTFHLPQDRPAHQGEVNDWVLSFRNELRDGMFEALAPGVISADGSRVEFGGPAPPFYRQEILNFLGARTRSEMRIGIVSSIGLVAFGLLFVVLFLLGEIDVRYLVCESVIFFGLPLFFAGAVLRLHMSMRYPKSAMPTLEGVIIRSEFRELFIPWNRIVGKSQPTGMGASSSWEALIAWTDNRGRIRQFQASVDVSEWIDWSKELAESIPSEKRTGYLVWHAAPPGTPVLVSNRRLKPYETGENKLHTRFPIKGFLREVYVSEGADREIVRSMIDKNRYDSETLMDIGSMALVREYWDLGELIFSRVLESDSGHELATTSLAWCLLKQEKHEAAEKVLRQFLATHAPSAAIHVMLSLVAMASGDEEASRFNLGSAVEMDPDNVQALNLWFDYVLGMGGFGQAIAELDWVSQTHIKHWGPPYVLATRLSQVGDGEQADKYFEEALKRDINGLTVMDYIEHLMAAGRIRRAIEVAERVLDTPQEEIDSEVWLLLADVFETARSKEKAKQALRRINLEENPEFAEEIEKRMAFL